LYSTLEVTQKIKLSKSIVSAIRSQDPPGKKRHLNIYPNHFYLTFVLLTSSYLIIFVTGRFLALNKKTELYYDIGNKKAIEKVSQALREGQQKTKQKMAKIAGLKNTNQVFQKDQP